MSLKIAVYAIAKNEEQHVKAFCVAAAPADYIVIADTGSTDGTVDEARRWGAHATSVTIDPWRFDHARNAALDLVPADADVCVSVDLDEILQPGWREEIERCWELPLPHRTAPTRMRYFYDWSKGVKYKAEKIHARHGYTWQFPVHEDLRPLPGVENVWCETDKMLIVHHPDDTKSRGGYRPLLKLSYEENPDDPRAAIYYGRDLAQCGDTLRAAHVLKHYLSMAAANWPCERAYAMRLLADMEDQEAWLLRAAAEYPHGREAWCLLAQLYHNQQRWAECYGMVTRALSLHWRDFAYCGMPEAWSAWPHDLASVAAWNLGLRQEAVAYATAASLQSTDPRIADNLAMMQDILHQEDRANEPWNPNGL